jgi:hypothetical protein
VDVYFVGRWSLTRGSWGVSRESWVVGRGLLSCPVIGCHINIVDLLITGEYYAATIGSSLQFEF